MLRFVLAAMLFWLGIAAYAQHPVTRKDSSVVAYIDSLKDVIPVSDSLRTPAAIKPYYNNIVAYFNANGVDTASYYFSGKVLEDTDAVYIVLLHYDGFKIRKEHGEIARGLHDNKGRGPDGSMVVSKKSKRVLMLNFYQ